MTAVSTPWPHPSFYALNWLQAFVLDEHQTLWQASTNPATGRWGEVPPTRIHVADEVYSFQPVVTESWPNLIYTQDQNGVVVQLARPENGQWDYVGFVIDDNVKGGCFDGKVTLGVNRAYTLHADGTLWMSTSPDGQWLKGVGRAHVASNVSSFQTLSDRHVFVLDEQGNLSLLTAPQGGWNQTVSPQVTEIWPGIASFQALSATEIYAVDNSNMARLMLLQLFERVWFPHFIDIDADGAVISFQGVSTTQVYALHNDAAQTLLLETAAAAGWEEGVTRDTVDKNVGAFQALDAQHVYVQGTDQNLWFEHTGNRWGQVPPAREQVDANMSLLGALQGGGPDDDG